jgi:hypothetical protein
VEVRTHDFMDRELGKVNPYGVYDQTTNTGWVSVGTDHDTAAFAVETIRRWWLKMGRERYPLARDLLITADGGGSNGYRLRLWKVALQAFANETALTVHVCHFPPGTSVDGGANPPIFGEQCGRSPARVVKICRGFVVALSARRIRYAGIARRVLLCAGGGCWRPWWLNGNGSGTVGYVGPAGGDRLARIGYVIGAVETDAAAGSTTTVAPLPRPKPCEARPGREYRSARGFNPALIGRSRRCAAVPVCSLAPVADVKW